MEQHINTLIRHAAEQSTNIIVLTDHQHKIIWVNESFTDNTDYSHDEVIGQPIHFLFRQDEPFDPGFSGFKETKWYDKQGHSFWVHLNQMSKTIDGQESIIMVANLISKLKDLEVMSREQQILIDGFSNSFSEMNIVVGDNFQILALNKLAKVTFSKLMDVHIQKGHSLLKDFPTEIKNYFGERLYRAFGGERIREKRFVKRFRKYYNLGFYPIGDLNSNIIAVSVHVMDITKEVKYLNRLRKQKNQIANIAWDNSHRLRRPAANILGLAEWLHKNQIYKGEHGYIIRKILDNSVDLDLKVRSLSRQLEEFK